MADSVYETENDAVQNSSSDLPPLMVVIADPGQVSDPKFQPSNSHLPRGFQDLEKVPSRYCYWRDLDLNPIEGQYQSLMEPRVFHPLQYPTSNDLYEGTRLFVVSWDSANGDPLYRSDATAEFLKSRARDRLAAVYENAGIVLMESQAQRDTPSSEAYHSLFGDAEMSVSRQNTTRAGSRVVMEKSKPFGAHPLIKSIGGESETDGELTTDPCDCDESNAFLDVPAEFIPQIVGRRKRGEDAEGKNFKLSNSRWTGTGRNQNVWFGWFEWWGPGWVPLMYASGVSGFPIFRNYRRPVLLARTNGKGVDIATTMWISANQKTVSRHIVYLAEDRQNVEEMTRWHKWAVLRSRAWSLFAILIILFAAGFLSWILAGLATSNELSQLLTILGVGLIAIWTIAYRIILRIFRRPVGINFLTALIGKPRRRRSGQRS
ncbi:MULTISPECIES: hypothetical protein [unclassified Dietzia]|uniref:hypothetical protein n=1 Tax=unclassified Dietzia TaxID=2617939 RepID=UPI0015FAFB5F|nr:MULTISPECIES: hypothetical protein [unclassified Dietzia]MBB1023793.1 hypothetical protein [Dietzia sp. DQ12-76]MBB1026740.1 hypothetical protein [Dietzia sp. DQ11-38-2]